MPGIYRSYMYMHEGMCTQYHSKVHCIGAFSAILPWWNRSFYLQFDLGKTSSDLFEYSAFTSVVCGQKYRGKE